MATFFVPKGNDGLILCSPLAYGLAAPTYESNAKATFRVSEYHIYAVWFVLIYVRTVRIECRLYIPVKITHIL